MSGPLDLSVMLRKRITIVGTTLRARPLEEKIAATVRFASEVVPWLERGLVRPVVDSVFAFEDFADAQAAGGVELGLRQGDPAALSGQDSLVNRRGSVRYQGLVKCRRGAAVAAGELPVLDLEDKVVGRDKPAVVGDDDKSRLERS